MKELRIKFMNHNRMKHRSMILTIKMILSF